VRGGALTAHELLSECGPDGVEVLLFLKEALRPARSLPKTPTADQLTDSANGTRE